MSTRLTTTHFFDELTGDPTEPKISAFFPTHRPGEPHHASELLAHHLLSDGSGIADQFGDPLTDGVNHALELIAAELAHPLGAMAAFVSPDTVSVVSIPTRCEEEVIVGSRFQVTPLIPLLDVRPIGIVALSRNEVRWFTGDRWGVDERVLDGAPNGIVDASPFMDHEKQLQHHGQGAYGFHGHEERDDHEQVDRYLRAVVAAIDDDLGHDATLAAVAPPELAVRFVELSGDRAVAVPSNPTGMSGRDLHRRVMEAIAEMKDPGIDGDEVRLERIAEAAVAGRVDRLAIDPTARLWGVLGERGITLTPPTHHEAEELINRLVHETVATGGSVVTADRANVPVSARLRY